MRKQAAKTKPQKKEQPADTPKPTSEPAPSQDMSLCEEYLAYIEEAGTPKELDNIYVAAESDQMPAGELEILRGKISKRKAYLSRGERSNPK